MRDVASGFSDQVMGLVKALRTDAPDCVASGVVDMSTGMLLSYETVDNHPPEVLDLRAGAYPRPAPLWPYGQ
ncbi:hypothetical protein SALBM311S_03491 [Streptomyces alboniger]